MSDLDCKICKTSFVTKYNLKAHLVTNKKCLKLRGLELQSNFICKGCKSSFINNTIMTIHMDICKKYITIKTEEICSKKIRLECDQKIKNIEEQCDQKMKNIEEQSKNNTEQYEQKLKNIKEQSKNNEQLHKDELTAQIHLKELEYIKIKSNYDILEKAHDILEKAHEKTITKLELKISQCDSFIQTLARDGSNKITTTTHNTVNNVRTHLSSIYTMDTIEPKKLEDTMRQHYTENVFFGGQKRLAGICVEKVIKTPDGKMMICCSDMARKKFKILDVQGNLKEDIEARLLCQKLKVPIQMITKEIYDKVIDRIDAERDRLSSDDRSRREKLLDDSMRAQQFYIDNLNFDDLNYNQDFMHELCVLLNVNV